MADGEPVKGGGLTVSSAELLTGMIKDVGFPIVMTLILGFLLYRQQLLDKDNQLANVKWQEQIAQMLGTNSEQNKEMLIDLEKNSEQNAAMLAGLSHCNGSPHP